MALEIGSRLGHYDVTALIGEGGMGQVYQATDTKLNRQVALKILPEAFTADPDRLARFQREAHVLASLNHPGIAAIYGLEEADDTRALVLELVEGPTLAERIAQGAIPLDETIAIGTDAPICQDTPLGGPRDGLARAEVCHDALVDLAGEEAFEAPNDVAFGAAIGGTSHDVVDGGLAVAAPIEAVPASGHPRRGRDRTRAGEFRERRFRANPVGVIAEDDEQLGRGVGANAKVLTERGGCLGRESGEVPVVCPDFIREGEPASGERAKGVLGGRDGRVEGAGTESSAAREERAIGEGLQRFSQRGWRIEVDPETWTAA